MRNHQSLPENGRILHLPIRAIRLNPSQPREAFDPEALRELASSIEQYGILQPLTVRRRPTDYELVAGARRLRAAKLAGFTEVPCILLTADEERSGMVAMVENLQRRDLDYIEEAQGLARLMRLFGLNQEQTARRIGKSQSAIANKLRLLRHSPEVLNRLREHRLSERHARALLKLPTDEERLAAISVIARQRLTVAGTEAYIDALLEQERSPLPPQELRKLPGKELRLFLSSVHHALELIRGAGIAAEACQEEKEGEMILTIRLPGQEGWQEAKNL